MRRLPRAVNADNFETDVKADGIDLELVRSEVPE